MDYLDEPRRPTSGGQYCTPIGGHVPTPIDIHIIPVDPQLLKTFNCFAYALGIADTPRYQALVQAHSNSALANSVFVSTLVADGELHEVGPREAQAGNIVLYLARGVVQHAGVIVSKEKRLRSKWGPSEFYEHGLWEVPASYGDEVKLFETADQERIFDLLESHIRVSTEILGGTHRWNIGSLPKSFADCCLRGARKNGAK
jgi:hypothetical protein